MDLIRSYGDSDEDGDESMGDTNSNIGLLTNPSVADFRVNHAKLLQSNNKPILYNPTYDELNQESFGTGDGQQNNNNSTSSDQVQQYYMDDFTFNHQYYKSQRTRKRKVKKVVSDRNVEIEIDDEKERDKLMQQMKAFNPEVFVIEEEEGNEKKKTGTVPKVSKEEEEIEGEGEEDSAQPTTKRRKLQSSQRIARPGELLLDAKDIRPAPKQKTRLPKNPFIHFKKAHSKGINRLLFFPTYGHLLLSGSVDSTIKLWDVHHRKKLVQTYFGYGLTVHDLCFSPDGTHFISTHGDGAVKVWDTEYGKVASEYIIQNEIQNATNNDPSELHRKMIATCVKYNPRNEKEFICGYRTNQIIQWDVRVNHHIRNYDKHQKGVNDLLFVKHGSRFLSTSHDGSIRVWEYGNSEDSVRYISENYVKVGLRLALHPIHPFFLVQSITSNIFMFRIQDHDEFRFYSRRKFTGHKITRYPVRFGVSHDGKWIFSGDSEGGLWFWRWDEPDTYERKKNIHSNIVMDCAWHPNHRSCFASCGWDGEIKMFR